MRAIKLWPLGAAILLAGGAAAAADLEGCRTVRFSDVGWTDITSTTAATSVVVEGLGYQPETEILSVPVTYASLKNRDIDVFLGNWMPSMEGTPAPTSRTAQWNRSGSTSRAPSTRWRCPPISPSRG